MSSPSGTLIQVLSTQSTRYLQLLVSKYSMTSVVDPIGRDVLISHLATRPTLLPVHLRPRLHKPDTAPSSTAPPAPPMSVAARALSLPPIISNVARFVDRSNLVVLMRVDRTWLEIIGAIVYRSCRITSPKQGDIDVPFLRGLSLDVKAEQEPGAKWTMMQNCRALTTGSHYQLPIKKTLYNHLHAIRLRLPRLDTIILDGGENLCPRVRCVLIEDLQADKMVLKTCPHPLLALPPPGISAGCALWQSLKEITMFIPSPFRDSARPVILKARSWPPRLTSLIISLASPFITCSAAIAAQPLLLSGVSRLPAGAAHVPSRHLHTHSHWHRHDQGHDPWTIADHRSLLVPTDGGRSQGEGSSAQSRPAIRRRSCHSSPASRSR